MGGLQFLESFGVLPLIDAAVQTGRGVVGAVLGPSHAVYRLGPNTTGTGIISPGSQIAANFPALFERLTDRKEIEIESSVKALFFTCNADLTNFKPGDVFVQNADSYRADRGVFTLVANRTVPRKPVFVSTPIFATFARPESNPQHIDSGRVPQSVPTKEYEWPLTVTAGDYLFEQTGTPVTVPVGMVLGRLRDMPRTDTAEGALYDDTRRQTWDVFAPLLPGQPLIPRDILTGMNGDRYELAGVQSSTSSFFGQLITVNRIRS
ncbi:MAG: hypothetical protein JWO85_1517 [Candidatus Eremiobacteraeota bacterium]|nr:hypothetical protein [Candidatus Eremiobacteraeota bacterium]